MIQIDTDLEHITQHNCIKICFCWEIKRQDGYTLRFTNHDLSIELEGNTYSAVTSINPSATQRQQNLTSTNKDFKGFLVAGIIDDDDIRAGLYDNSNIREMIVDWSMPFKGYITSYKYIITKFIFNQGHWEARIESRSNVLKNEIGEIATKMCKNQFGDDRCRAIPDEDDINVLYTESRSVYVRRYGTSFYFEELDLSLNSRNSFLTTYSSTLRPPNTSTLVYNFFHLTLEIKDGPNTGYKFDARLAPCFEEEPPDPNVLFPDYYHVQVSNYVPYDFDINDLLTGRESCLRTMTDCYRKNNGRNFRGFPYLPGNDVILKREDV